MKPYVKRADVEIGRRVAQVRAALNETGAAFAERLEHRLHVRGFTSARYDKVKVSRMESGERHVTLDEGIAIAEMDPRRRGPMWLAIGEDGVP